jgi:hypothetical protein
LIRKAFAYAVSAQLLASASVCLAQDSEKQRAFTQLITDGYEIKAVTLSPAEEGRAKTNHILVTLQKDKSVAVCTFAPPDWENMADAALANAQLCDVRQYAPSG